MLYGSYHTIEENAVKNAWVIYDSDLNFRSYIDTLCWITIKSLGFFKGVFNKFKLIAPLKALYYAVVRSTLEFALIIWGPHTASDINQH